MRQLMIVVSVLAAACSVSGCASTGVYLGSDPGMHVPPISATVDVPIDPKLEGLIEVRSVDMHGALTGEASTGRSLYLSVDITGVLARPNLGLADGDNLDQRLRRRRNNVVDVLLFISDFNCETYLSRAFANRTFIDASNNVLQDVASGVSSGTAAISPQASAAIGLSALVIGSASDEISSSFYLNQTFQAMETVIRTERSLQRRRIERKLAAQSYEQYSLHDALSDVRVYSETCSIRAGLQLLAKAAEQDRRNRLGE